MDRHAMIDQVVEARLDAKRRAGYAMSNPDAIRLRVRGDVDKLTDSQLAAELGSTTKPASRDYGVATLDQAIGLAVICLERGFGVDEASRLVTEEHGPAVAGQAVAIALDRTEQGAA